MSARARHAETVERVPAGRKHELQRGDRAGAAEDRQAPADRQHAADANAVISNFATTLQLKPLEISYVTEAYFQTPDVNMQGFLNSTGIYSQAFF